jgi:hypothetical protein
MTTIAWELNIGLTIIGYEMHTTKWQGRYNKLGTLLGGPSSLREIEPRKIKTTLLELS